MHEHPSVSQTFVVTEAAAVRSAGAEIMGYALARGSGEGSAADLEFVCVPPSKRRLALAAARGYRQCLTAVWQARKYRPSVGEMARLVLAQAHAEYVWRTVRDAGVTHIHAHFLARTADVSLALAKRLGCLWTATSHGSDAYAPNEPALLRRRLDHVSGIACANGGVETALRLRFRNVRPPTRVVHCGVDIAALEYRGGRSGNAEPEVLTVGRLVATKGHWTVIAAADRMIRRHSDLRWAVIGGGELASSLEADARYRACWPRLSLAGPMGHEATLRRMQEAAALVLPCEQDTYGGSDGIPVALMEAMSLGIPVVTTNVGGIKELVVDGVTGFIVEPRDAEGLVTTLERVLYKLSSGELEEIKRAGRATVERDFNATKEAATLLEFFRHVREQAEAGSSGHRVRTGRASGQRRD
jgi:colanic acid/amylovoran biosynthesis glycosyltransferase